jgi:dolichol-phosphate mannosyltransferase
MYDLTVLIEMVCYTAEIGNIVSAIESELKKNNITGEIIISLNNLSEKTCDIPVTLKNLKNLTILFPDDNQENNNLLSYGLQYSKSENLIFFNVRYSFIPTIIIALYNELQSGKDLVIGNRNCRKTKKDLRIKKHEYGTLIENSLVRLLFPKICDPTSDIFAIKKEIISTGPVNNSEKNPLLEILGKANWKAEKEISLDPYVKGIPITISPSFSIIQYLRQVVSIFYFSIKHRDREGWKEIRNIIKFGIVGISGIIVNTCVLYILSEVFGIFYLISSFVAIELSIINNFIWNDFWTFGHEKDQKISMVTNRFLSYHIVSIGGMLINIGVLVSLTEVLGIYYLISNLLGIFVAFSWNFLVNRMTTWRIRPPDTY